MLSTREISLIVVLTATCVATNYLMIGVVNVKVMDLIIFVSGLTFGAVVGSTVGALTWLVYGVINPYGFSLPILFATSICETMFGIAGGVLKGMRFEGDDSQRTTTLLTGLKYAFIGFLLTAIYDLFTNFASALTIGLPFSAVFVAGIPFAIAHEVSNSVFFFFGVAPLKNVIQKIPHFSNNHVRLPR